MAMRLTNAAASAGIGSTGLNGFIGATPKIKLYSGSLPTSVEDGAAGTLLVTIPVATFGAPANGVITTAGSSAVAITASGTAAVFELYKSDGTTKVGDGTVAKTSGGDINMDENAILINNTVTIGSTTLTLPPN